MCLCYFVLIALKTLYCLVIINKTDQSNLGIGVAAAAQLFVGKIPTSFPSVVTIPMVDLEWNTI